MSSFVVVAFHVAYTCFEPTGERSGVSSRPSRQNEGFHSVFVAACMHACEGDLRRLNTASFVILISSRKQRIYGLAFRIEARTQLMETAEAAVTLQCLHFQRMQALTILSGGESSRPSRLLMLRCCFQHIRLEKGDSYQM